MDAEDNGDRGRARGPCGENSTWTAPATTASSTTTPRGNCFSPNCRELSCAGSRQSLERRLGAGAGEPRAALALSRAGRKIARQDRASRARTNHDRVRAHRRLAAGEPRRRRISGNMPSRFCVRASTKLGWEPEQANARARDTPRQPRQRPGQAAVTKRSSRTARERFQAYLEDPANRSRRICACPFSPTSVATPTKRLGTNCTISDRKAAEPGGEAELLRRAHRERLIPKLAQRALAICVDGRVADQPRRSHRARRGARTAAIRRSRGSLQKRT